MKSQNATCPLVDAHTHVRPEEEADFFALQVSKRSLAKRAGNLRKVSARLPHSAGPSS